MCNLELKCYFIIYFFLKGCEILIVVHSAIDDFEKRMGVRDTWIQFVTQGKVSNVSVVFLIGNQNIHRNMTNTTQ